MRTFLTRSLVVLLSATMWAQTAQPPAQKSTETTTKITTTKTVKKPVKNVARKPVAKEPKEPTEVQVLKQEVDALRDQLQQRDNTMKQIQQQLNTLQSQTTQIQGTANSATSASQQNASALSDVVSAVSDLKASNANTTAAQQQNEKRISTLESPLALHYKGVDIVPIAFADLQFMYRSRNLNSESASNYANTPFNNSANAGLPEFKGSSRLSRLGMMASGQATPNLKLSGYWEGDFQVTSPGSSDTELESWVFRLRQLWGRAESTSGWAVNIGQSYSLFTPNRKGVAVRQEWQPINPDAITFVGNHYKREAGIRLEKSLSNKVAVAISAENSDWVLSNGGAIPTNVLGLNVSATATPASGITPAFNAVNAEGESISTGFSGQNTLVAPDVIAKVAFDPSFGHFEVRAIGRTFRNRIALTSAGLPIQGPIPGFATATCVASTGTSCTLGTNPSANSANLGLVTSDTYGKSQISYGYGIAFGAIVPATKKVDIILDGAVGRGIGSYSPEVGADVTVNNSFQLVPLKTASVIFGFEAHPTPKIDFYGYAGTEYYAPSSYTLTSTIPGGFGSLTPAQWGLSAPASATRPAINATGCTATSCNLGYGNPAFSAGTSNKNLDGATLGYSYRFFRGPYGTLQQGLEYIYYYRSTWPGVAPTLGTSATSIPPGCVSGGPHCALKGSDNVVFLDLKYILP